MPSQLYEEVVPFVPAFVAYEKALVNWFRTIRVPRDDSHSLDFRIEYAGGEKAIRAIKALKGDDARNDRGKQPVVTIRLNGVEYNAARYHPPESFVGTIYDGPRNQARRAARISKPAPWKLTYAVEVYSNFEIDLRYAMGVILQRFHQHGGGLSYLQMAYPTNGVDPQGSRKEIFPLWLRSYSHGVENGDTDRTVKGSMVFELEAYLALPFHYVPTFRHYYQTIQVNGSPGEAVVLETSSLNP
jgi:hypothetical protein